MEIPTGFMEARAHGFYIITRPVYYKTAVALAEKDPETLFSQAGEISAAGEVAQAAVCGSISTPGSISIPRAEAPIGPMRGRGPRLEVPGEGGETLILKKQMRGGLYGRLMGDIYKDDYRAVAEVVLSETAWKKGVPVALLAFALSAPAGRGRLASYRRGYCASIRLPGARNLMEWLTSPISEGQRRAVLAAAAAAISRAHDRGLQHGDLNLGNILVVRSEQDDYNGWLIDLLGSKLGGALRFKPRLANLMRLYRSVEKWLPDDSPRRRFCEVVAFLRAYTGREPGQVRRYLQGAGRYRASLLLHRLSWAATGEGKAGKGGKAGGVTRRSSVRAGR